MLPYDVDKKNALDKMANDDRSRKGSIDKEIVHIIDYINSTRDFYTTSSCSGRIMLILEGASGKKNDATWVFSSHDPITVDMLLPHLKDMPKERMWFRMEPPILHISPRDETRAKLILDISNQAGFRRAGAISLGRRIVIEILAPGIIDTIVSEDGRLLVTEEYLSHLVRLANMRLGDARKRLERFYEALKDNLDKAKQDQS